MSIDASDTNVEHAQTDANAIAEGDAESKREDRRRLRWMLLLGALLALLAGMAGLMFRYVQQPQPLPDIVPLPVRVSYPPHYVFSIYGVDKPVGVALSDRNGRVYVTESGGERQVKMFERDGGALGAFAPPRTRPAERSPVYLATDGSGRVFVTDRLQHAIFVYDKDGNFLDAILGPNLTLSEYVAKHAGGLQPGDTFAYNQFEQAVHYQRPGEDDKTLPPPDPATWSPLGIRVDGTGRVLLTDVAQQRNLVRELPADVMQAASWQDFNPSQTVFGGSGQGNGQLMFPNAAVADSRGRIYVSDGNNARISVWDGQSNFLFHFGRGTGDSALSLPRGAAIDERGQLIDVHDRLYVVDAVGQNVKVFDVSADEPKFLFAFGDWGQGDGQFNYPNDIALDSYGRLYVADRENNRVQVWSY
jgi:DNA-binding beta-propeller fold protein YncE